MQISTLLKLQRLVTSNDYFAWGGGKNLRIIVGTNNIANNVSTLAEGLRSAGHSVITVGMSEGATGERYEFAYDYTFKQLDYDTPVDFKINDDGVAVQQVRFSAALYKLIESVDHIVFTSGSSFGHMFSDLPLLNQIQIPVTILFSGSEVRDITISNHFENLLGNPSCFYRENWNGQYLSDISAVLRSNIWGNQVEPKLYLLRVAELYATNIISSPSHHHLGIRSFFPFTFGIPDLADTFRFEQDIKAIDFLHMPTAPHNKGTQHIVRAFNEAGLTDQLIVSKPVPRVRFDNFLRNCRFFVDQSAQGGLSSYEAIMHGAMPLTGFSAPYTNFYGLPNIKLSMNNSDSIRQISELTEDALKSQNRACIDYIRRASFLNYGRYLSDIFSGSVLPPIRPIGFLHGVAATERFLPENIIRLNDSVLSKFQDDRFVNVDLLRVKGLISNHFTDEMRLRDASHSSEINWRPCKSQMFEYALDETGYFEALGLEGPSINLN